MGKMVMGKTARPVTHGTRFAEIMMKLDIHDRMEIARVMARAAERSYRRGFQQGSVLGGDQLEIHDWRYLNSLDVSVWRECGTREGAESRLFLENPDLEKTGMTDA